MYRTDMRALRIKSGPEAGKIELYSIACGVSYVDSVRLEDVPADCEIVDTYPTAADYGIAS